MFSFNCQVILCASWSNCVLFSSNSIILPLQCVKFVLVGDLCLLFNPCEAAEDALKKHKEEMEQKQLDAFNEMKQQMEDFKTMLQDQKDKEWQRGNDRKKKSERYASSATSRPAIGDSATTRGALLSQVQLHQLQQLHHLHHLHQLNQLMMSQLSTEFPKWNS